MSNSFYSPSPNSGYLKALTADYKAPLSPILLTALKNRQVAPEHDPCSSDIFSLGVTLLATCTNQSFEGYYNWQKLSFDYAKKGQDLLRMSKIGYSHQLVELINMMIEETETRRINLQQIQEVRDEVDRIG